MGKKPLKPVVEAMVILLFLLGLMALLFGRYRHFQLTHLEPLYGKDRESLR